MCISFKKSAFLFFVFTLLCSFSDLLQLDIVNRAFSLSIIQRDDIRVAPNPFETDPNLPRIRENYKQLYLNPDSWKQVQSQSGYFEIFFEMLYHDQNVDFAKLGEVIQQKNMKVALQTGGLRPCKGFTNGLGKADAEHELIYIKNWENKSKTQVSMITTDNAINFICTSMKDGAFKDYTPEQRFELATTELAEYFAVLKQNLPNASFGFTEALGNYNFSEFNGVVYKKTVPSLDDISFEKMIQTVIRKSSERGVVLTHFDIDFTDAVRVEARHYNYSKHIVNGKDYGRILASEKIIKQNGLNIGIFINSFHDRMHEKYPEANIEVKNNTLEFYRDYKKAGGNAVKYSLMFWQPYPNLAVPETSEYTATNIIRDVLSLIKPIDVVQGLYRVNNTVYFGKGNDYYLFDSMEKYLSFTGKVDLAEVPFVSSVPRNTIYKGYVNEYLYATKGLFRVGDAIFRSYGSTYKLYDVFNN